jgi:hypothetical protein
MLVFIIPLKSSRVSTSWTRVSQLFERCLKSVCNQTSPNFRVIVVCHEKPDIQFSHPQVEYLEVDFPLPGANQRSKRVDRGRKLLTGLAHATQFNPCHIMAVDADDCVNQYLAEFVERNSQGDGWFIDKGYIYREGQKLIYWRRKDFSQVCGTGIVIKSNLFPLLFKDDIYQHKITVLPNGTPLESLPLIGAIYSVNGENFYRNDEKVEQLKKENPHKGFLPWLKEIIRLRWLTASIRNEFGLSNIDG